MQRVSVTTQSADVDAAVGQNLLKFGEGSGIFEHREFAVRVARIVSGGEFDGIDLQSREFLKNRGQRKLRQQGGKHSYTHIDFCLLGIERRGERSAAAICRRTKVKQLGQKTGLSNPLRETYGQPTCCMSAGELKTNLQDLTSIAHKPSGVWIGERDRPVAIGLGQFVPGLSFVGSPCCLS